jgi:hypothetical protein
MYEIESGVDIPKELATRWKPVVSMMKCGDSIVVKNTNEAIGLATAIRRAGFVAKQCKIKYDGEETRVWKLKER